MSQTLRKSPAQSTKNDLSEGIGATVGGIVGVAGAMATGAVIGTATGPIGAVLGAAVGAVAGGLAGKIAAHDIDATAEEKYWRECHPARPYAIDKSYNDYAPAYRYGWESYSRHHGRPFSDVEVDLQRDWDNARGKSKLEWQHAKHAARDAWNRIAARHEQP
jgi:hypothetical protein